jgi:cytochrome c peroxidase
MEKRNARVGVFLLGVILALIPLGTSQAVDLSPIERLGKQLFFDTNVSSPPGQACAACHAPEVGFTGPLPDINAGGAVYPGAMAPRFGNRKPPTSAYGGASPILYYDEKSELVIGGMFWDGRATGWTLGDPLAEQAQGPFLNPLEQNLASPSDVIGIVAASSYATLFEAVWGPGSLSTEPDNIALAYERVARSISAYEKSTEVNPFSSKYDAYLKKQAKLTPQEHRGLGLFKGKGKCANCHLASPGRNGEPPLFTDFTYDNLGIPKNPTNPFYTELDFNPDGANWIDPGLGGFLATVPELSELAAENYGKHKVPTLRNVDKRPYREFVKAYGHNGYFKSLKEIVHFYNTRDVAPWPPPEVPETVNTSELGNLRLSDAEEDAIVEFLKTLSDGYEPTPWFGRD